MNNNSDVIVNTVMPGLGRKQEFDAFVGISILADAEADPQQPKVSIGLTAVWPRYCAQRQYLACLRSYDIVTG